LITIELLIADKKGDKNASEKKPQANRLLLTSFLAVNRASGVNH